MIAKEETKVECPRCAGFGSTTHPLVYEDECSVCKGVGYVTPAERAKYLAEKGLTT